MVRMLAVVRVSEPAPPVMSISEADRKGLDGRRSRHPRAQAVMQGPVPSVRAAPEWLPLMVLIGVAEGPHRQPHRRPHRSPHRVPHWSPHPSGNRVPHRPIHRILHRSRSPWLAPMLSVRTAPRASGRPSTRRRSIR